MISQERYEELKYNSRNCAWRPFSWADWEEMMEYEDKVYPPFTQLPDGSIKGRRIPYTGRYTGPWTGPVP